MKQFCWLISLALFASMLGGCLASSTSPDGINCGGANEQKPLWERPLACQGR